MKYRFPMAVVAVAVFTLAVSMPRDIAAQDRTYKPVMSVKNIMRAVNHEEHGVFGQLKSWLEGNPGRGDKQWSVMVDRSMLMSEAGNILQFHEAPYGGDASSWAEKAKAFMDECKRLKSACIVRKPELVRVALARVRARCDACHKAHRPQ